MNISLEIIGCPHAKEIAGDSVRVQCELKLFGGTPKRQVCLACKQRPEKSKVSKKAIPDSKTGLVPKPKTPPLPPKPVEYGKWPLWAKAVSKVRRPAEVGVGDTIKTNTGVLGNLYEAMWDSIGLPCHCPERRDDWNIMYAYSLIPA